MLSNWTYQKEVGVIDMDVLMRLDPLGSRPDTSATGNISTQRSVDAGESKRTGGTMENSRGTSRNGTTSRH